MGKKKQNTKFYSHLVFDDKTMKKYLSTHTYEALRKIIDYGAKLNLDVANEVAAAMKDWAVKQGATHFTHWFQPLNGTTSEKHDSFLLPYGDAGKAIFSFSGKDLISGESDASSFPNGGLRATFEARGYTAWDPSSNAFIKDEVLCIPTAFCSYNGQALDKKTPLLKSMDALKKELEVFLGIFNIEAKGIDVNIGIEQEFFLIPKNDYKAREDLVMTGRTLFGNKPVKGQELEEHYYGCLRPTVSNFMKKLDNELWALGIPAHTKHNEAAPSQHELAPIYSSANRAIDENLIMMEKMQLLASKFDLACLLHERPFDGINGSGKHCNWSVSVDGINLLDPGNDRKSNLRFLAVLSCVISAVDQYQDLLRMSVASLGNDHRLGGNEAPPAIVSIYLGDALQKIIDDIAAGKSYDYLSKHEMNLGASVLPSIMRDSSDRNRTSPFAFSANKFEFRMPGSQANVSDSVMVLNTAIAKSLKDFVCNYNCKKTNALRRKKKAFDFKDLILACIADNINQHKRIIFNGDGYSEKWRKEAKKRGLANYETTADALSCMLFKKNIELFETYHVLSKQELESRYLIYLETYNKLVNIEAKVMHRMVKRTYLPAISKYAGTVSKQLNQFEISDVGVSIRSHKNHLRDLLKGIENISSKLRRFDSLVNNAAAIKNQQKRANFNAHVLLPVMQELRDEVDRVEHITGRDFWPVPSYNNMLFYV